MIYTEFSLNGAWEMNYCEDAYTDTANPWKEGTLIKNAVPGYWEDMTDLFLFAPFFCNLKINPEYGLQRYPISGVAPDMALPNILGNFFYHRSFTYDGDVSYAVIHFEGVQNSVSVWLNNTFLGSHEGYSTPFDIEIPDGILSNGENDIVLSISNHRLKGYCDEPVLGLTSRAANECTGGVTGDVCLRMYNCPLRDVALIVSDDCASVSAKIELSEKTEFQWYVLNDSNILKSGNANGNFTFSTDGLEYWSPENPKLYRFKIVCGEGTLERSFGVRRLKANGVHFDLNGLPYYLRGICEHCYFPDTVHPNHDAVCYRNIIKAIKRLGFNFIRFHTYIPEEEYMQAADELGILLHVECPNNTSVAEWREIVKICRRHTSVVIYCCGNELLLDEPFIEYLNVCADEVHSNTDSLFSPMSALRGVEYFWMEPDQECETLSEPFKHHPRRINTLGKFCDMYNSFTKSLNSYRSLDAEPKSVDDWSIVYNKPRVSHEICIDGTYTDLSLKDRYRDLRIGKTDMFSSIERHLEDKGILKNAPLYFKNSCQWQRRVRKYCFETTRMSDKLAGYDFLGPIDTHWHTFGYDVGMMNEFYELKPGETERNILMYNSPTVILNDLMKKCNFTSGETINTGIYVSHYGTGDIENFVLHIRLMLDGKVVNRQNINIDRVPNGSVSKIYDFSYVLPEVKKPCEMKLYVTIDKDELFVENEWELYIFPETEKITSDNIVVSDGMSAEELRRELESGKNVLLLSGEPFANLPTSFRISLAGRTAGNLATVIREHPALSDMPHDGFCSWQFEKLMEDGSAVCFENDDVPFNPIIEVVSTHKFVIRQASLFEFNVFNGKLMVCSFNFDKEDAAANWLKSKLISYAGSDLFSPCESLSEDGFYSLVDKKISKANENTNVAFNINDKTAVRKQK